MNKPPMGKHAARGVLCPRCRGDRSYVVDSRPNNSGGHRRRRQCLRESCRYRWTTIEVNLRQEKSATKKELTRQYRMQLIESVKENIMTAVEVVLEDLIKDEGLEDGDHSKGA